MFQINNVRMDSRHYYLLARLVFFFAFYLMLSETAFAHEEDEGGAGFLSGLFHPALGVDHLLAMLSVGILSAQIGGRAIWHVPAAFVAIMIVGGILGMRDIGVPMVEAGIALSVLVLGIALAADKLIPEWLAIASVAVFGTFHGHAHGTEMPLIANPWIYGLGFVIGTSVIHIVGVFIGFGFKRLQKGPGLLRATGLGIAGVGCWFLFST
jgi:urease accessory protein